jgi:sigma-B regulation protein RsbU (phosphoserine phosphatase)
MSCDQLDPSQADILIVDDTPANLQLLSKMLSEHGYRVRPVSSGTMALSVAQIEPPDLVLLDIRMPDMDGYMVCEHLKADEKTSDIPIIFISALDDTQDKVRAFQTGCLDYITKPFQVEEVLARVETHLTLRNLQVQLQNANAKMVKELALAGEVQASFLRRALPKIPGWQLTVTLHSSRETSGDFYDIDLLPNGRLGLLVADVVDKGAGAALFMALSWALFRTYALEFPTQPEFVLDAVNKRILEDTHAKQFVTAFYGILEPATGNLVYCNAGHCPPFLINFNNQDEFKQLIRTGTLLGIFEDQTWAQGIAQLDPGDLLVLYSDGITEARNVEKCFFGEDRLMKSVRERIGDSAQEIHDGILGDLHGFMGEVSQSDDIALSVLKRELMEDD